MKNWEELHIAYEVAKLGTVAAAAEALDKQRATIIRHIDNLELEVGTKLFHRHTRGYTPTEAGKDLLRIAKKAEAEFNQLKLSAQRDNELYGDFIITSLNFIAPFLLPVIKQFQAQNPQLIVRYLCCKKHLKLEWGQAHIAIRTGSKPQNDDYVVQPLFKLPLKLFAHQKYVDKFGLLTPENLKKHKFVCVQDKNTKAPPHLWIRDKICEQNIVFTSNDSYVLDSAIIDGIGIGAMPADRGKRLGLVEMGSDNLTWNDQNWLVTHIDLHFSEKVQKFLQLLKNTNFEI